MAVRVIFVLCLSLFTLNAIAHPLHVSICEVEYNEEDKALEIVVRMFIDEMESAVLEAHEQRLNLGEVNQSVSADSLMKLYLFKHFTIQVNEEEVPLRYMGSETENQDRVVCYLTITDIEKIQSIFFFNELFQELFEDQINMLHLEIAGKKQSTFFTFKKREETFEF